MEVPGSLIVAYCRQSDGKIGSRLIDFGRGCCVHWSAVVDVTVSAKLERSQVASRQVRVEGGVLKHIAQSQVDSTSKCLSSQSDVCILKSYILLTTSQVHCQLYRFLDSSLCRGQQIIRSFVSSFMKCKSEVVSYTLHRRIGVDVHQCTSRVNEY